MQDKKEFILQAKNDGKLFGKHLLKIIFDDEDKDGAVACEIKLSDSEGLDIKKGDKIKVIIEKISDEVKPNSSQH